jgi:ferritin-like protein
LPRQILDRSTLLARGAVLLASGGILGAAGPADAAATAPPDGDLAYLMLLVGVELLKLDYGRRAVAANRLGAAPAHAVKPLVRADRRHYAGLAALVSGAGQTPATAGDVDFSYPRGSFGTQGAILELGRTLSTLAVGAYLGAVQKVQTPELRLPLGQIAANEAQQAGAFGQLLGGHVVGSAFAASMQIDAVSAALDEYES